MAAASDQELMHGVQANDARAFAELYHRHAARARRVAHSVCQDAGRAEDAVQEGFLSAWRSRASYVGDLASVENWLIAIVRNRAIDSVRYDSAVQRPRLADADYVGPDPVGGSLQDEVIARSAADGLRASLQRLPDEQAEVVALAFYGELTHSEIATRLCLPPGTVKSRVRLGLKKLREQIELSG